MNPLVKCGVCEAPLRFRAGDGQVYDFTGHDAEFCESEAKDRARIREQAEKMQADAMNRGFRAALQNIVRAFAELWIQDPHKFSRRPCSTCRALSDLVGAPFGCDELRRRS